MHFIKFILTSVFVAVGFCANIASAADPTLHEVYQAAESGDLKKAQSMMNQVMRDRHQEVSDLACWVAWPQVRASGPASWPVKP